MSPDSRTPDQRQRDTILEQIAKRERELDAEIKTIPAYSPLWWRRVKKMNELRVRKMELEGEVRQEADAEPKFWMICVRHSRPDQPSRGIVKPYGPEDLIVVCEECVMDGAKLRERIKTEGLTPELQRELGIIEKPVESGKHGLAVSPPIVPPEPPPEVANG